jgi:hypothetical protein
MNDEPEHSDELPAEWPSDVIGAEEAGVRVFWVSADTMHGLVERLALVLGVHMADGDELHVTYNAMPSGWQDHAPRKGNLIRSPEAGWTELRFEYSAFVVLRARGVPPSVGGE